MSKFRIYAPAIALPLLSGAAIGLLTSGSMDFDMLKKPPLSPPVILFPIVWTILYVLMGVSYGLVKDRSTPDSTDSLVYYLQLGVNLLWPVAFFVLKWRLFAFFWLLLLDALVIIMALRFCRKDKTAGRLQIPYTIWVLFATYLNFGVWILNQ
ncbi:MAG: tryptophan-rich sensory protein [Ruminococcus sp.]|nr:tryptophan-rich sensory protein [Ruminococcus sp.]